MRHTIFLLFFIALQCSSLFAQTPQLIVQQEGHLTEALQVRFSPDERQALSAEADRLILWDMNSGKFVRAIPTETKPRLISFSPSGQEALALLEDGSLNAWDLSTGALLWKVMLPIDKYYPTITFPDGGSWVSKELSLNIQSVIISRDRRYLAASYDNKKIACWDLQDGRMLWNHPLKGNTAGILCFLEKGNTIALSPKAGSSILSWDTKSGKKTAKSGLPDLAGAFQIIEANKVLAEQHSFLELHTFQQNIQKCFHVLEQDGIVLNQPIVDFAFSTNGKTLAIAFGIPTSIFSITPGLPSKRRGKGALMLWNTEKEQLLFLKDSLPEIVNQVDVNQDGNLVLTASSDQTVRLWEVSSGNEKFRMQRGQAMESNIQFSADFRQMVMSRADRTLKRWELDQRNELAVKEIFADNFLLSPDGHQLIRTDRNGNIYQDSASLEFLSTKPLEDQHFCLEVATALAISPDGKKILTGSSKEGRVMFYNTSSMLLSEVLHFVTNKKGDTIGFVTTQSRRVKMVDGLFRTYVDTLTLYGNYFSIEADAKSFNFSPDLFNISLWDLEKRQSEKVFYADAVSGWYPTSAVGFSPDGNTVYATVQDKKRAWNIQTAQRLQNEKGLDYFHAVDWTPPAAQAASILEDRNTMAIWTLSDGKILHTIQSPSKLLALAFHPDGHRICALSEDGHLTEWDEQTAGIVKQTSGILSPENLAELALDTFTTLYGWNLLQYAPDPDYVLLRTALSTAIIQLASGKTMLKFSVPNAGWASTQGFFFYGHQAGQVSSIHFLPDGKRVLVTFYDGTIQCWNYKTGALVLTVYFRGSKDWVVTTPSGLFDASPGAMNLMYFVLNREVIDLDQIKERYYQPGLLPILMGFVEGEIREAREFKDLPMFPELKYSIDGNQLSVNLTPRQGGLGKLSLFVNGKQVAEDINLERLTDIKHDLSRYAKFYRSDTTNSIALRAYNAEGWLKSQVYEMKYTPVFAKGEVGKEAPPPPCGDVKPNLYLVVVGTSRYTDASKSLSFPDIDASEMAKALSSTGQRLFGDQVYLKLLSTAGDSVEVSNKTNIEAAFKEIAQKATPCDVIVAYFSGHGANWGKDSDKSNFYYLTKDITTAKLSDPEIRSAFAISDEDLTRWLAAIPAQKQVLILDACNSGKAAESMSGTGARDFNPDQVIAFELLKDKTGTFILTGSTADMSSFESNQYGQGLLTYSLLQGMSGTALKEGKYIDIMTLFQSARNLVPKLAQSIKQVQTPVIAAPKGASSFPIGIKDESVKIEVAQLKPVMIWSNFQDRDQFNDPLNLSQALNDYFHGQTAKGAQAKYVYYDIPKYLDGYSIRGNYTVAGDQVNLAGRLFKGDQAIGDIFRLNGSKDSAVLVKLILKEVGSRIK